jgi:hypothetical protein
MGGLEAFPINFSIMNLRILIYGVFIEMPPSLQMLGKKEEKLVVFHAFSIWRHSMEAHKKGSICLRY